MASSGAMIPFAVVARALRLLRTASCSFVLASRALAQSPPTVTIELVPGSELAGLREVVLRVTIDDADGDLLDADLLRAPGDLVFAPVRGAPPPVTRTLRWRPNGEDDGLRPVVIEARDRSPAALAGHGELVLDVARYYGESGTIPPWQRAARMRRVDLDGDGRLEIAVPVPQLDVGGIVDAGAIVLLRSFQPGATTPWQRLDLVAAAPAPAAELGFGGGVTQDVQELDVDGDGFADLVASSRDLGWSLHVWFGPIAGAGTLAADAQLHAPTFTAPYGELQTTIWRDVTGDGVRDLLVVAPADGGGAADAGAIHLFAGGTRWSGVVTPTASFRLPGAAAGDRLGGSMQLPRYPGDFHSRCVEVGDVTGDGIDDVVAAAPAKAVGGATAAGQIGVWPGGPAHSGVVLPVATLELANPHDDDVLGVREYDDGLLLRDVTGDGVADVVVPARYVQSDAIFVFEGGAALTGSRHPRARLIAGIPGRLFGGQYGETFRCFDFDRDGVDDLVALMPEASVAGIHACGAILFWKGGAGLAGAVRPTATLIDASPADSDQLGVTDNFRGLRLADLDGDGALDLLLASRRSDVGPVVDAGAVMAWRGGVPWSGLVPSHVRFEPRPPDPDCYLGQTTARIADVTGDGIEDIVVSTQRWKDAPAGQPHDRLHVFAGAAGLGGSVKSRATLVLPPHLDVEHRWCIDGDVTGDGIADVVAYGLQWRSAQPAGGGAPTSRRDPWLAIWEGGPALSGEVMPRALARLPLDWDPYDPAQLADLTGDGILDLVVADRLARVGGVAGAGRAAIYTGGATLQGVAVPLATLVRAQPAPNDGAFGFSRSSWCEFADLDGDGALDLVAAAPFATVAGVPAAGALLWFPSPVASRLSTAIELTPATLEAGLLFGR